MLSLAGPRSRRWLLVLLVAWWAFSFQFVRPTFYNDHFDHLSKARQVLLGELPQRDFFDPGRPLTIYLSAAAQKISPTLFSEFLLTTIAITIGVVFVYTLTRSLTSSSLLGVIAALLTVSMQPRLYAYPKIILFPLGLWLLWRYIDQPDTRRLIGLAVMTVVAFLFRYDYGIDIAAMTVATLIALHKREATRPVAIYMIVGAIVSAPYVGWLAAQGQLWSTGSSGLLSMAESAPGVTVMPVHFDFSRGFVRVTPPPPQLTIRWSPTTDAETRRRVEQQYALHERERKDGRTTQYFVDDWSPARLRSLLGNSNVEDTAGVNRSSGELLNYSFWRRIQDAMPLLRVAPAPIFPTRDDAAGWIYYVFLLSPPIALIVLWFSHARAPTALKVVSLAVLCLLLHQFMLRGSIDSRLPDVTGPTAVLLAWLARVCVDAGRRLTGRWIWSLQAALAASMVFFVVLMWTGVTTYAGTTWQDVATSGWPKPVVFADISGRLRLRPLDYWTQENSVGTRALTRYVAECLAPDDRLLLVTYAPEVFYVSERSFAGGINFFHAGAFSSPAEQKMIVTRLGRQSVPVVIVEESEADAFKNNYPTVESYVTARYRQVAVVDFGDPSRRFQVLVDARRTPVATDSRWSLPCFQPGTRLPRSGTT